MSLYYVLLPVWNRYADQKSVSRYIPLCEDGDEDDDYLHDNRIRDPIIFEDYDDANAVCTTKKLLFKQTQNPMDYLMCWDYFDTPEIWDRIDRFRILRQSTAPGAYATYEADKLRFWNELIAKGLQLPFMVREVKFIPSSQKLKAVVPMARKIQL